MQQSKKRILITASLAESLVNFRGPLISALLDADLDVHVAAPEFSEVTRAQLTSMGVTIHQIFLQRTGTNPISDLKTFLDLRKTIRRVRPDIFLAYTVKPVVYGLAAAYQLKVPHKAALITGLGYAFINPRHGFVQKTVMGLYKYALKNANIVFFQNPDDHQLFIEKKLLSEKTPFRIVNGSGIDIEKFPPSPLPSGKTSFLMIARLLGDKGTREYIEAAKIIKKKYQDAEFHLVGWIDQNPDAIKQTELDGWISDNIITYWGKLSDVRPAIAATSVYVLPSYREGTPRTVLEGMAMGRPIITTDAPGCRETVIEGENGFLVPIKSPEALAQAMETLINDRDLLSRMAQRSREIAEERYDVHKVNHSMLEVLIP